MSYQVLYRKYRPREFSEVVGQAAVVRALSNAVKSGRIAHAYLFSGPRGVGKTTAARILARAANGFDADADVDVIEIDAASNRGIEEIRALREAVRFVPTRGKYKTYIVDEVHMLTKEAFNALLKTLEEPPEHAIFILATTEIEKVPATIISRTQHYEFRRPTTHEIAERLLQIAAFEGVALEANAARVIAIAAEGSVRDAESIFGQVLAVEDKRVSEKEVETVLGLPRREAVLRCFRAFADKDAAEAFRIIRTVMDEGHDAGQFLKALIAFARAGVFTALDPALESAAAEELLPEERAVLAETIRGKDLGYLKKILAVLTETSQKFRRSPIPELPLELAALEITAS